MDIRPFRGWRYPTGDVSNVIAPPYDVLNQGDKDALLDRSRTNIVAVDLPHMPPKELGPDEVYQAAADRLATWKAEGVLVQEDAPALYAYEQTYTWAGKTYHRRAMLCGLRAAPLGTDVIPHEHTFDGPKADRLRLTETTQMQLSPIFGFYRDPTGKNITDMLFASVGQPLLTGELNGVREALWVVDDAGTIAEIQAALANTPAYIADGHHRYTTAMNYAKRLREEGTIDSEHETNFVLFCLVSRDDAGLLVLPTHRVIAGLKQPLQTAQLQPMLGEGWRVQDFEVSGDLADADAAMTDLPANSMIVVTPDGAKAVSLLDPRLMQEKARTMSEPWRTLDVAILHELLLPAIGALAEGEPDVTYTPNGNAARDAVRSGEADAAVLMRGTPVTAVEAVADEGESMPHKSTYFYPKLATGMVLKPLQ